VDSRVDASLEERLLELLDEHAALPDLAEGAAPVAVAGGRDRHERNLAPGAAKTIRRQRRLRQGEAAAARADADEHQRVESSSPNRCRTASA
jgi:hypothetical protein